jgi:hypothetical protein
MYDLTGVSHHPVISEIMGVLGNKLQNKDESFFRVEIAYFISKIASTMRAKVLTKDRGEIPVNTYVLALANSGFGKGHSVNVIEDELLKGFRTRFMEDTFKIISEGNLWEIANQRALRNNTDQAEEYERVEKEFKSAGALPFTFDSGTPPAVKQLRHKLLMSNCGSINLQIDEIGSNLIANVEVLTLFLELYDQGKVKQKLTKNTAENQRGEELEGKTPTNMLLFGTPSKLLDGGQTEDQFYSFLETGYARRCLFGYGKHQPTSDVLTPEEVYARLVETQNDSTIVKWSRHFETLADPAMYDWRMSVEDDTGIELIKYKIDCETRAKGMKEHEEIKKAEMSHRYFKALKLAGAFAFLDKSLEITIEHLKSAILLTEQSGDSFQEILNREKAYNKLARYIAEVGTEVTHADLNENLPFYKQGSAARNEMMTMAIAWGYKQHIIIKKRFIDGIEFFQGETLQETDISKIGVSYSDNWAYNYHYELAPFDKLHELTQVPGLHWANHSFKNNHRAEDNVIPGFNLVVIDVDGGIPLATVHDLMKEYKFMTYTTKRHSEEENRFRLLLPTNYCLQLDSDEYKEFMNGIMNWLPFAVDESSNQRAKKWESFDGEHFYNLDGDLLDVLPFIPKTSRNEQLRAEGKAIENLDNLERWFAPRIATGNRNNQMVKFAFALVDSGMDLFAVREKVLEFNKKLSNALPEDEIESTILVSVAKRFQGK